MTQGQVLELVEWLQARILKEGERLMLLREYLAMVSEAGDWHGVEDCGSDIRDCIASRQAFVDVLARVRELADNGHD